MTTPKAGSKGPATSTKKAAATLGSAPRQWVPLVGFVEPAPQPQDGNTQGWARLRELVNAAVGDYVVQRSPDATMLAALLNDVLHECTHENWSALFVERVAGPIGRLNAAKARGPARAAAEAKSLANRQRVATAWGELVPTQRGPSAAGLIARATGLSEPTVRRHLVALGHR